MVVKFAIKPVYEPISAAIHFLRDLHNNINLFILSWASKKKINHDI